VGGRKRTVGKLTRVDPGFWRQQRVLVTGHTGFIGGWLALALKQAGAQVSGFSLPPDTNPALCDALDLPANINSIEGDITDLAALSRAITSIKPTVVLHLAAEAIVRRAHHQPVNTYNTNVMGTLHVLEVCRQLETPPIVVVFTTDKVYANDEQQRAFTETDALGGKGIYDSSKSAADQLISAYHQAIVPGWGVATIRAGNVIGGGDWSPDRLIPDAVRALVANTRLQLRYPQSVRPWQHVIEPVFATMLLSQKLAENAHDFCGPWNIGPQLEDHVSVGDLVSRLHRYWGDDSQQTSLENSSVPEAKYLFLDTTKAIHKLQWQPLLALDKALALTADWYKAFYRRDNMSDLTLQQLKATIPGL
jgi:CDP-glucose 4,6-dehydratase